MPARHDHGSHPNKMTPTLHVRRENDLDLPFLVWRFAAPMKVVSCAPIGGGLGVRSWIVNAQVRPRYDRVDLDAHVEELATLAELDLDTPGHDPVGVAMLTAANVAAGFASECEGVSVRASVGIRLPLWAAAPSTETEQSVEGRPGTINVVAFVPAAHTDAALINLATTTTEAKAQAMFDAGLEGTGTATDAICIVTPIGTESGAWAQDGSDTNSAERIEPFGGPRSIWGSRVARAVHEAVLAGIGNSRSVIAAEQAAASARGASR